MPRRDFNDEIRSEEVRYILSKVPNWMIRWGNTFFLIIVLGLLASSWFIQYPDIVTCDAVITTEIPPQREFAKISGKIDSIFVKDAQFVNSNQPLAIIENTAKYSDVMFLKSIIDTIQFNNHSICFPHEKIPILFLGEIESSFSKFENSYLNYILNKDLDPFSNEEFANQITMSELKSRISNLHSQIEINRKELNFQLKDLNRSRKLFKNGVISEKDFESKELEYLRSERNFKNLNSSISQLRESYSNIKKSSRGTEISRIREEKTLLKSVIHSLNELKKSIIDWEMKYMFKSKIEGKVSFLNYWSENQDVKRDDLVFTVIPSANSSYIAKLKSPAQNLGKVMVGQIVNLKLDNYPNYEFGVLKGRVISISEISDIEGLYTINVKLPKKLVTSFGKGINFKQEMKASGDIITEDLRLIQRIFYQLNKLLMR